MSISVLNETFGNQEMKPNRVMLDIVLQSINHGPRALGHLSYSAIVSRAVGILGYIRRALRERGSELIYYNKQSDVRPGGHCTGR